ncbi:MAG: Lrp/AsnC ligand binding domain-containing protein [Streptosporangiaceae bacterium]
MAGALASIPEVLQVDGISGQTDLLVHVVATDADDLYRTCRMAACCVPAACNWGIAVPLKRTWPAPGPAAPP